MSGEDELAKRLAALRSPSSSRPAALPRSNDVISTNRGGVPKQDTDDEDELSRRLAHLETPTDEEASFDIPVEQKNVDDQTVEALLASLNVSSSEPVPRFRATERVLAEYEARAPIEISFAGPPLSSPSRTEEEDEALIRRMQDELDVEKRVLGRSSLDRAGNEWEERMAKLNGVVSGRSKYETNKEQVPSVDGIDELREKAKKAHGRRKRRSASDSEDESDTDESKSTDDESDSDPEAGQ